jgi:hypothetical protein
MRQGWWVQRTEPQHRHGLSSSPCRQRAGVSVRTNTITLTLSPSPPTPSPTPPTLSDQHDINPTNTVINPTHTITNPTNTIIHRPTPLAHRLLVIVHLCRFDLRVSTNTNINTQTIDTKKAESLGYKAFGLTERI